MTTLPHTHLEEGPKEKPVVWVLKIAEHAANSAPCLQPALVVCKGVTVAQLNGRNRFRRMHLRTALHTPNRCGAGPDLSPLVQGLLLRLTASRGPEGTDVAFFHSTRERILHSEIFLSLLKF